MTGQVSSLEGDRNQQLALCLPEGEQSLRSHDQRVDSSAERRKLGIYRRDQMAGRRQGQSLPVHFAQSVSQSFLGINLKCASCHDSLIDQWTLADSYNLAAIYSEEPLELTRCDKPTGVMAKAAWLFPEIGQVDPPASKTERLGQLAALFTHPQNGRVARTIVNRLWARVIGRGIVHPLDAMGAEP